MFLSLYSTLLALAAASPVTNTKDASPDPCEPKTFSLSTKIDNATYPFYAVHNGTAGTYVIKIADTPSLAATPAYSNGTGQYKALDFLIDGVSYGLIGPEVGDDYGHAFPVTAVKGKQQEDWIIGTNSVGLKPQAALDFFYACKDEVNGAPGLFLKYGISFTNGQPPTNCPHMITIDKK